MKKKKSVETFTRTEGSYIYTYGKFIAASYAKWCAFRRSKEANAFFFDFYSMLPQEEKDMVEVREK